MDLEVDLLREMAAALPDPVFVITESGRYAAIAGGSDAAWYHDGSHLKGVYLHDVLPAEKADWFLDQVRKTLTENRLRTVEYALHGEDVQGVDTEAGPSGVIRFEGRVQPLSKPYRQEAAVVWVARNITSRHAMEGELRRMSETDPLTGVFNRRKLVEQLDERFREFRRYGRDTALIMFDIDHFKGINDRFGHGAGDDVLCRISALCIEQLRDVDLFCRVGGEEFACLLPGTGMTAAVWVADRLRQVIAENPVRCGMDHLDVTISAGVSAYAGIDASPDDIIRRADDALYAAKRSGRNQVEAAD